MIGWADQLRIEPSVYCFYASVVIAVSQRYNSRVLRSENDYLLRHITKAIPKDNILVGKKLYPISKHLRAIVWENREKC